MNAAEEQEWWRRWRQQRPQRWEQQQLYLFDGPFEPEDL